MSRKVPGYNGKILRVNLTNLSTSDEATDELTRRRYIGGAGFIAYFLWKELKPGVDALSPDNILIFALGPITGLSLAGASRNCVGAKSPLTGGIAKAEVGGYWAAELKRAGYDAIIVEGKASKPVYLWVHDGEANIKDAAHLWGKDSLDTQEAIRAELSDKRIHVAMIGPAGENLVRFACIMEGCHDAAGRGGMGAVMGSKNLKAIAVRGHALPPVADMEKIKEIRQQFLRPYGVLSIEGTGNEHHMISQEASGDLPVRNFGVGLFPEVKQINGGVIKSEYGIGMDACYACPVRCKKVIKMETPYKIAADYGGPEYETIAALGSDCGVGDLPAILKGNERCNAYSLDSISTGSTIAFVMECYEKGLITKADTGGLEFKWGDKDVLLEAIDLIAYRKGFGNLMAEGTARLAKKIGKNSNDFAMHVKGLESGMHEARIASALALGYMLSPIGADHGVATPDELLSTEMIFQTFHPLGLHTPPATTELSPYKVRVFQQSQFLNILRDSMVVCSFPDQTFDQCVELLKAATGWDTGIGELMMVAERIVTFMRLFNLREGVNPDEDRLPERFYQPKTDGVLADYQADKQAYERARRYYYTLMGWNEKGIPLPEKAEELGIENST
jgi:aldehyde:ferredoxin oxidoreductase